MHSHYFYDLHTLKSNDKLKIISTKEFLELEGGSNGHFPIPTEKKDAIMRSKSSCTKRAKNPDACMAITDYFQSVGFVPQLKSSRDCLIFDQSTFQGFAMSHENELRVATFCGKRNVVLVKDELRTAQLIHFQASEKNHSLLSHFYGFVFIYKSTN